MENLNAEQIKYALGCCVDGDCYPCPYAEIGAGCRDRMCEDALALIKELTEENKAWQKQLIATEEQSGKAYYDLACEVEDLRAENERLRKALSTDISFVRVCRGSGKTAHLREVGRIKVDAIRADTVRKMQKELIKGAFCSACGVDYSHHIIQIAKEMLEGKDEVQDA